MEEEGWRRDNAYTKEKEEKKKEDRSNGGRMMWSRTKSEKRREKGGREGGEGKWAIAPSGSGSLTYTLIVSWATYTNITILSVRMSAYTLAMYNSVPDTNLTY